MAFILFNMETVAAINGCPLTLSDWIHTNSICELMKCEYIMKGILDDGLL